MSTVLPCHSYGQYLNAHERTTSTEPTTEVGEREMHAHLPKFDARALPLFYRHFPAKYGL